jgi:hypothetical protein
MQVHSRTKENQPREGRGYYRENNDDLAIFLGAVPRPDESLREHAYPHIHGSPPYGIVPPPQSERSSSSRCRMVFVVMAFVLVVQQLFLSNVIHFSPQSERAAFEVQYMRSRGRKPQPPSAKDSHGTDIDDDDENKPVWPTWAVGGQNKQRCEP